MSRKSKDRIEDPKQSDSLKNFDHALKKILAVSKEEMKRRETANPPDQRKDLR